MQQINRVADTTVRKYLKLLCSDVNEVRSQLFRPLACQLSRSLSFPFPLYFCLSLSLSFSVPISGAGKIVMQMLSLSLSLSLSSSLDLLIKLAKELCRCCSDYTSALNK